LVKTGAVAVFNGASHTVVALKELERVVQIALAGLDAYDPLEAARLIQARSDASAALDAINELRNRDRQAEADRLIRDMRARREAAHASIILAQERIQSVVTDLAAREPLNKVIMGLQVLAFSMRVYTTVDEYLTSIDAADDAVSRGELP
jgi:hypothetical protein